MKTYKLVISRSIVHQFHKGVFVCSYSVYYYEKTRPETQVRSLTFVKITDIPMVSVLKSEITDKTILAEFQTKPQVITRTLFCFLTTPEQMLAGSSIWNATENSDTPHPTRKLLFRLNSKRNLTF